LVLQRADFKGFLYVYEQLEVPILDKVTPQLNLDIGSKVAFWQFPKSLFTVYAIGCDWVSRIRALETLKTKVVHQKTFVACQNHMPEHQRAPSGTTMWLQHTWGP